MRQDFDDNFNLNVSYSKMKRVKRLVLEKLEGSYIDEFNKLEGYAQELKNSNPGTDVIINISREALEQGKRRFLRMYVCIQVLKKWMERRFEACYRARWDLFKEKMQGNLIGCNGTRLNETLLSTCLGSG